MQIHDYVRKGDFEGVAAELSNGADINAVEEETGLTPYQCVFENYNVDMMFYLVDNGAIPEFTRPKKEEETELEKAVLDGDLEKIGQLLDEGADLFHVSKDGYDVLTKAMESQNPLEMIGFLIKRGAKTNGRSRYGDSALSMASYRGKFDIVRLVLEAGGPPEFLEWTQLMHAIALGSLEEVERCLTNGADLAARDGWSRTPWLLSLQVGDVDKAKSLFKHGADLRDKGYGEKTSLMYTTETNNAEMLRWLIEIGIDIETTDIFGTTALMNAAERRWGEGVRILLDAGANIELIDGSNERAIKKATSVEVVRLLVEAGDDLNNISDEMRAELTGLEYEGELKTTAEDYQAGKRRRFGTANPEKMQIPFWEAMVRSGAIAYRGRDLFDDKDYSEDREPIWCFHRFGKSITELPDGRFIEIAGEHEDGCDPDFCIYNDVFVHHGKGNFDIYGYPREVFPPTDFHSATLVGKHIYIIGSLGYPEDREVGSTPVYRLDCESFAIEKVETTGKNPGWISDHTAIYVVEEEKIIVSGGQVWTKKQDKYDLPKNKHQFELNLKTMKWSKIG